MTTTRSPRYGRAADLHRVAPARLWLGRPRARENRIWKSGWCNCRRGRCQTLPATGLVQRHRRLRHSSFTYRHLPPSARTLPSRRSGATAAPAESQNLDTHPHHPPHHANQEEIPHALDHQQPGLCRDTGTGSHHHLRLCLLAGCDQAAPRNAADQAWRYLGAAWARWQWPRCHWAGFSDCLPRLQ